MKATDVFYNSALLSVALANTAHPSAHAVADLLARAVDPATMDPTRLSVLSVLKTAIPSSTDTGIDISLPTGDVAPKWYSDLPADIMVLLAQMYPATPTAAAAVSETAVMAANASSSSAQEHERMTQTTLTRSLELLPTANAAGNGSLVSGGDSELPANASTTLVSGGPSPAQSVLSVGAKSTGGMGRWSIVMGASVAAVFCFFA